MCSKEEAIRKVVNCAQAYQVELCNKKLLFVSMDKQRNISYFEVAFHDFNFLHLTGLRLNDTNDTRQEDSTKNTQNAKSFYKRCLAHKLSPTDFSFSDSNTTSMKLDVLPAILNKNLSAKMIGDFNSSKPRLYTEKLVGGSKACIGFILSETLNEYVPNTILKEDIRDNVINYMRIIATYRKDSSDPQYSELVYAAKNIDWCGIDFQDEYEYLPKPL